MKPQRLIPLPPEDELFNIDSSLTDAILINDWRFDGSVNWAAHRVEDELEFLKNIATAFAREKHADKPCHALAKELQASYEAWVASEKARRLEKLKTYPKTVKAEPGQGVHTNYIVSTNHATFVEDLAEFLRCLSDEGSGSMYRSTIRRLDYGIQEDFYGQPVSEDHVVSPFLKARKGDRLEWFDWYGGFCAAGGGYAIYRGEGEGEPVGFCNIWVS